VFTGNSTTFRHQCRAVVTAFGLLATTVTLPAGSSYADQTLSVAVASHVHSSVDDLTLALDQTLRHASSFRTREGAISWLSEMSRRLEARVPDPFYRFELLRLIHRGATDHNLDPQLVLSLIEIESGFKRFAVSKSGARGLMQVMPFWMKEIGHPRDNLFHPVTNLHYGCSILRWYLDDSDQITRTALARYNGGGDPQYAAKVLSAFKQRWSLR